MARTPSIRISERDKQEYQRLAKNSRAKIKRVKENYNVDLSSDISIPAIESFKTRTSFNTWKAEQSRFTNRSTMQYQFQKNKHGVVASEAELFKARRDTRVAQRLARELQKEVKNKPFISGGKQQGTVGQRLEMVNKPNVAGIYVPPDFNFDQYRERKGLEEKMENMEKRTNPNLIDIRADQMHTNFINEMEKRFNSFSDDLLMDILEIDPRDFFEMFMMYDEIDFMVFYEDDEEKIKGAIEMIQSYVDKYKEGKVDLDLKKF